MILVKTALIDKMIDRHVDNIKEEQNPAEEESNEILEKSVVKVEADVIIKQEEDSNSNEAVGSHFLDALNKAKSHKPVPEENITPYSVFVAPLNKGKKIFNFAKKSFVSVL